MLGLLKKVVILSGLLSLLVFVLMIMVLSFQKPVHAQAVNVGPGGLVPPGPYAYGTSGPGALPTCTANASPSMDGAIAIISNQASPWPSPTAGGRGYATPVATASTGQQVAIVACHAVTGEWSILR